MKHHETSKQKITVFGTSKALIAAVLVLSALLASAPAFAQDPFSGNPVAKIARELSPAVVNIDVEAMVTRPVHPFADDPFSGSSSARNSGGFPYCPNERAGIGIHRFQEGHILTNNHVVDGADKITVTFSDGKVHEAKVLGKDPTFDLAVLKIDGTGRISLSSNSVIQTKAK